MAGGHGFKYADLTLHAPKRWHVLTGKGMCAVMWLWVFYRAKNDGAVLLWTLFRDCVTLGMIMGTNIRTEVLMEVGMIRFGEVERVESSFPSTAHPGDVSTSASEVEHKTSRVSEGASTLSDGISAEPRDKPELREKFDRHGKSVPAMPLDLLKQKEKMEQHPKVVSLIEEDN